ncbi:MAG: hypothetical protein ACI8WB_001990, partial [Phenylobacterium sp.]
RFDGLFVCSMSALGKWHTLCLLTLDSLFELNRVVTCPVQNSPPKTRRKP